MDAMMNATLRAGDYSRLGLEPPKDAARLLEIIEAVGAACQASPLEGVDYDKLTAANVAKALREAALTQAVKVGMQQIAVDVGNQLGRRVNVAFAADTDRIITELRPRFLQAASTVTDAIGHGLTAEVYGNANRVMNAGPAAAGLFHATRAALAEMMEVYAFVNGSRARRPVAVIATLTGQADAQTLDTAQQILSGPGSNERLLELYALVGVAPALHTPTEAALVEQRAAALRQAEADKKKAAQLEAARQREAAWARLGAA